MDLKFTYPFRYTPHPLIVDASRRLIERIDADSVLRSLFCEGKMMGVLMVEGPEFLYAFSGTAAGRSIVDGFVPPVYDLTKPDGEYRRSEAVISAMEDKDRRKLLSGDLQDWIFRQYKVHNALGEEKSVKEIFAQRGIVPPGGTGDCAAPKLLEYAYRHSLRPLAMGEFWYGASPGREVRTQGCFYPSCTGKCGPLLEFMLRGLDVQPSPLEQNAHLPYTILYEDDEIIAAVKPHGMLSVPGKTPQDSLLDLLRKRCGQRVFSCHRLDMDTSGVMVYAKSAAAQASIQQQFEKRETSKSYLAALVSGPEPYTGPLSGQISLPLITDWYDRPRQMVDFDEGKQAITDYEILGTAPDGGPVVRFTPLTGRSHQLRVHAAHKLGLGHPIKGDSLYGGGEGVLQLQAVSLSFRHPSDGSMMTFSIPEEAFFML